MVFVEKIEILTRNTARKNTKYYLTTAKSPLPGESFPISNLGKNMIVITYNEFW